LELQLAFITSDSVVVNGTASLKDFARRRAAEAGNGADGAIRDERLNVRDADIEPSRRVNPAPAMKLQLPD
jgi:hypothetical protein